MSLPVFIAERFGVTLLIWQCKLFMVGRVWLVCKHLRNILSSLHSDGKVMPCHFGCDIKIKLIKMINCGINYVDVGKSEHREYIVS